MTNRFKKLMFCFALGVSISLAGNLAIPVPAHAATTASSTADRIISLGRSFIGTPYEFGAKTGNTRTFDCSSFVQYLYRENGISLPRSSLSQSTSGTYIAKNQLQPGDLVFFYSPVHHVAIYIGNGKILHAVNSTGVGIADLNSNWWTTYYTTARRVIPGLGESSNGSGGEQAPGAQYSTGLILKSVNFRTAPTTSSSRIRYLQAGEIVQILEKVNNSWYKVQDSNGQLGYLTTMQQYVQYHSKPGGDGPAATPSEEYSSGLIVKGVNFRTQPSVSSGQVIRILKKGETVRILEKVNNSWYRVQDIHGQIGYLTTLQEYVQYHSKPGGDGPVVDQGGGYPSGLIVKGVNFRTQPSVSKGQIIRLLKKGETVRILAKENSSWFKVQDQHGQIGYVTTQSEYME